MTHLTSTFTIRACDSKDYDQIASLIIKVIVELFGREPTNRDDYGNFKDHYSKGGIFYVAEQDRKIIGTIALLRESATTAKLRRMYVAKEHRQHGVGEQLFQKALQFCRAHHYTRLILCTHPNMQAAIAFYKKHGFREYTKSEADEATEKALYGDRYVKDITSLYFEKYL